ncbi:MAG: hypothetical protein QM767_17075 [Anaeromyxobacter sp.]
MINRPAPAAPPRSPEEALRAYAEVLAPTAIDAAHLDRVRATVERACRGFGVTAVEPAGSRVRGTAIRAAEPLDLLVIAPRGDGWGECSRAAIAGLAAAAAETMGVNTWDERLGAFVELEPGPGLQLIPAAGRPSTSAARPEPPAAFEVRLPDGRGGWTDATPRAHDLHLAAVASGSPTHLMTVRILRAWRALRPAVEGLSAFAMELALAACGGVGQAGRLTEAVQAALEALAARLGGGQGVRDPLGLLPPIQLASPDGRARLALEVERAQRLAALAARAEAEGDLEEARLLWALAIGYAEQ